MKTVSWARASLFACAVLAHSPQLFAQATPSEVAAPKAAPTVIPPPTEATEPQAAEPAAETAAGPAAQAAQDTENAIGGDTSEAPPQKYDIGTSRLEDKLHEVEAERASYSRFLPWLTVGVGAAMTLGGTAVGAAGYVYGCDGDCKTPSWVGILVVTGTFVATVGAIWVVHANADVRELDSKRYQLEQELDRIRFSSNLPNKSELHRSELFSMRFAFR